MRVLLLSVLLSSGCAATVYRDTWRPATAEDVHPMLLHSALMVDPEDVALFEHANAQLLGYHATTHGYAVRAASVGGTHFFSVTEAAEANSVCVSWPGVHQTTCTAVSRTRPTKIAVLRVMPEAWNKLPAHLVPPASDMTEATSALASVVRYGCEVDETWGRAECSNDWKLYRQGEAPTYEQCEERAGSMMDAVRTCEHLNVTAWSGP